MDKVAEIIGMAMAEFDGELVAYEAKPEGHLVCFAFADVVNFNEWWKKAEFVNNCYNDILLVDHLIPYKNDHDPVKRIATQLYSHLRQNGGAI